MLGRTPGSIVVTRPLREGVVANYTLTQAMLKYFLNKVRESRIVRPSPRVLIGVPSGSTQVERRAIRESASGAGARSVSLIAEPLAAALNVRGLLAPRLDAAVQAAVDGVPHLNASAPSILVPSTTWSVSNPPRHQ